MELEGGLGQNTEPTQSREIQRRESRLDATLRVLSMFGYYSLEGQYRLAISANLQVHEIFRAENAAAQSVQEIKTDE